MQDLLIGRTILLWAMIAVVTLLALIAFVRERR
jgi:hypothetical protein